MKFRTVFLMLVSCSAISLSLFAHAQTESSVLTSYQGAPPRADATSEFTQPDGLAEKCNDQYCEKDAVSKATRTCNKQDLSKCVAALISGPARDTKTGSDQGQDQ